MGPVVRGFVLVRWVGRPLFAAGLLVGGALRSEVSMSFVLPCVSALVWTASLVFYLCRCSLNVVVRLMAPVLGAVAMVRGPALAPFALAPRCVYLVARTTLVSAVMVTRACDCGSTCVGHVCTGAVYVA